MKDKITTTQKRWDDMKLAISTKQNMVNKHWMDKVPKWLKVVIWIIVIPVTIFISYFLWFIAMIFLIP